MGFEPGGGAGKNLRPVEAGGAFGAGVTEAFVFVGGLEELDDAFGDGGRGFGRGDDAGLVVESGLDEPGNWINDRGGAHGIGFEDVQAPAFANGGVDEEMSLTELGILLCFAEHAGEGHSAGQAVPAG